jgi:hypothetical protein
MAEAAKTVGQSARGCPCHGFRARVSAGVGVNNRARLIGAEISLNLVVSVLTPCGVDGVR